jgi:hypothetical protein
MSSPIYENLNVNIYNKNHPAFLSIIYPAAHRIYNTEPTVQNTHRRGRKRTFEKHWAST